MMGDAPLRSSALPTYATKRKSHFWAWFSVVVLMLVVAVYAGWHYGINDKLGVTADRRAVDSRSVPLTLPQKTEGTTDGLLWRDVTMEDGLRCRLFKAKSPGVGTGFVSPDGLLRVRAISCDWANYSQK